MANTHKIIFLDVDNVLNNHSYAQKMRVEEGVNIYSEDMLDPSSLACLQQIVNKTGAKIVLSSAWRWQHAAYKAVAEQLDEYDMQIYSTTNMDIKLMMSRGEEIKEWLENNPHGEYLILDDDDIFDEELHKHHIQTEGIEGLKYKHVDLAIKILNGEYNG